MSRIKVSELFYSLQGEGKYMGVPSIFLRTFGCNFTCQGFGMPDGELSKEYLSADPALYSMYENLPLVTTGCDSYASWDTRFKHLSPMMEIDDLVEAMMQLLPNNKWEDVHLVITGGEPLLGWQKAYPDLLNHPKMQDLKDITFETNGTQPLSSVFKDYLSDWKWIHDGTIERDVTFSVSAKLSNSGESREAAICPAIVYGYEEIGYAYLKFVVATEEDVEEALETIDIFRAEGFNGPVYLMPVGGVNEVYNLNNKRVAELAMQHGLRYSDRLHLPLFGNKWGT